MICKMKISALKSIDKLEIDCSKMNIITGTNSSGKSTFIQAILLLFQNMDFEQGLNGELVTLGDFRLDVKNYNISSDKVGIEMFDITNLDKPLRLFFTEDEDDNLPSLKITFGEGEPYLWELLTAYSKKLQYLSCDRIGAKDVYMKNYSSNDGVGKNGEYSLFYLQTHKSDTLDLELLADNSSETLYVQVNYWLKYIINSTITVEDVPSTDIVKASYSVGEGRNSRPRNVGSGISYIISVIIMCLASKKDDILIIENPEIHLHPKAQSKVCEFFYFIARSGRQLFIETHSDHIFNGVRAGLATGKMNKDDVIVNFFELDENNCTKNTTVEFGKRGRIINYTEGLFDQFDIDLNKMLEL